MNYSIDETDGAAFAIRVGYEQKVYPANLGRGGGGTTRRRPCAWCINSTVEGAAQTITLHYHKEGWSNFLGTGSSLMLATAVIEVYKT